MVFAVATEDSVLLYDTQQPQPFAYIGNIHYHQLSDVTWWVGLVPASAELEFSVIQKVISP